MGVQQGHFSHTLLALHPSALTLVDPWEYQSDPNYRADAANVETAMHRQHLERVVQTFGQNPLVRIVQGYSQAVLRDMTPGSLDAVYIDGNHTYQAVLADLAAASSVIHDDGLIMGHDFCSHWRSRQGNFGVVGAVLEFCKTTGADLFGLTCSTGLTDHSDSFSTFFLAKTPTASLKLTLLDRIFGSPFGLVELPTSIAGAYNHIVATSSNGNRRYIPSFCL